MSFYSCHSNCAVLFSKSRSLSLCAFGGMYFVCVFKKTQCSNGILNYTYICALANIIFFNVGVQYKSSVSCHRYTESAHYMWHADLVSQLHLNVMAYFFGGCSIFI